MSTAIELQEMKGKITWLQNYMLNFTGQLLSVEERNDALMHPLNSQVCIFLPELFDTHFYKTMFNIIYFLLQRLLKWGKN